MDLFLIFSIMFGRLTACISKAFQSCSQVRFFDVHHKSRLQHIKQNCNFSHSPSQYRLAISLTNQSKILGNAKPVTIKRHNIFFWLWLIENSENDEKYNKGHSEGYWKGYNEAKNKYFDRRQIKIKKISDIAITHMNKNESVNPELYIYFANQEHQLLYNLNYEKNNRWIKNEKAIKTAQHEFQTFMIKIRHYKKNDSFYARNYNRINHALSKDIDIIRKQSIDYWDVIVFLFILLGCLFIFV